MDLDRLITNEEIDKKLDKQIRERDRKELIEKIKQKIIGIFRKKRKIRLEYLVLILSSISMISRLAFVLILGKPLIMYLGILTFLSLVTTAILGLMIYKGRRIPFKLHPIMAVISLVLACIHGTIGLSIYFKF